VSHRAARASHTDERRNERVHASAGEARKRAASAHWTAGEVRIRTTVQPYDSGASARGFFAAADPALTRAAIGGYVAG
jgi:hypothetical protein